MIRCGMPFTLVTAIRGTEMGHLIFEANGGFMRQKLIMRQSRPERLCLLIESFHFNPRLTVKIRLTD